MDFNHVLSGSLEKLVTVYGNFEFIDKDFDSFHLPTLLRQHRKSKNEWYQRSYMHPLIKSAVFHYEFEFIRPFADGNARIGRMWHSLLLGQWKEVFFWLPIEELIKSRHQEYYDSLAQADKDADSAVFAELMLEIIRDTLSEVEVIHEQTGLPKELSDKCCFSLSPANNHT